MGVHDLKIINGKVIFMTGIEPADLIINNGFITGIHKPGVAINEAADRVIDAKGRIVMPGLVDMHVHFRDPGYPEKEDFTSGSLAAAAGGFTTVADMPNTSPPTNSPERLEEKRQLAQAKSCIDCRFHGAPPLLGSNSALDNPEMMEEQQVDLASAEAMREAGLASFKIYMPHGEGPYIPILASLDIPLTVHAEDPTLLSEPKGRGVDDFLRSRPAKAEFQAIDHIVHQHLNNHIHICHISTAAGLRSVLAAQKRGVRVTCEVTPHHLLLTKDDLRELGPIAKCYPPLRTATDRKALVDACLEFKVNLIASDHAPHTYAEKLGSRVNYASAPGGIPGVETTLPLLNTYLVNKAGFPLHSLHKLLSFYPALWFNLKNKYDRFQGHILEGAHADLVIFDHKDSYKIRGDALHGKAKYTPFEGWEVQGKVLHTIYRGTTVFEEDG
jgi:dihydroorotase